jgi:hypothetical protein
MKADAADVKNVEALKLDYYDRTRIASWVRSHPSVILWVRGKIGKPITGWRPFGAWVSSMESAEAEYLLDDQLRVETGKEEDGNGLNALARHRAHPQHPKITRRGSTPGWASVVPTGYRGDDTQIQ